jgi:hypothetical protein
MLDKLNKGKKNVSFQAGSNTNEKACEASFIMSYHAPKAGIAHTVAKTIYKATQ